MKPAAQRIVAELLGRQLGMDAGEVASALDGDPVTTIFTLSMMGQANARDPDADAAERVIRVAAIVGACTSCLGDDPHCTECRGMGRPGSRMPDVEALLEWIDLPLRRAGLCVTALRRERPEHNLEGEKQ
jgi:hypothetical protein